MRRRWTNLALLLGATACQQQVDDTRTGAAFIRVALGEGTAVGSEEMPLPFSSEETPVAISVEVLDHNGDRLEFNGTLALNVRPGSLTGAPYISANNGTWSGVVGIKNGFGPTRIWVTDSAPLGGEAEPSFATGVSDPLNFRIPTIGEMNRTDDHETNQLQKEFAEIRVDDRNVRVTAVGTSGFWVSDLDDAEGEHNSLFIYTFSKPDSDVEVGKRLTLLTGNNQEYLATTQISFPTYEISDEPAIAMPEPAVLESSLCGMTDLLEGYESGLVQLEGVEVPSTFGTNSSDEDYADYLAYGQWPVTHGSGCTFYINSAVPCPDFVPTNSLYLPEIKGLLSEIWDKWVVNIRGAEDLPAGLCSAPQGPGFEDYDPAPSMPLPRERPSTRISK